MRRLLPAVVFTLTAVALSAPAALAGTSSGEGTFGEVNDKVTTNAGFIVIFAIPLFLLVMTLLQSKLEARKERRKDAERAAAADGRWGGGW